MDATPVGPVSLKTRRIPVELETIGLEKEIVMMSASTFASRAFTLVEVLIVVIVLGILAAVVAPQLSTASDDTNLQTLTTNLQTIRSQLDLYKTQHNGNLPALATFHAQMTAGTQADGTAGSDFGPYLLEIPPNPFTGNATITHTSPGPTKGWYYDVSTNGYFRANDSAAHRAL